MLQIVQCFQLMEGIWHQLRMYWGLSNTRCWLYYYINMSLLDGLIGVFYKPCRQFNYRLTLQWPHNEHDGFSNHQPRDCLLNRLFKCRSKKTSKLRVTCLCAGTSPWTGEFPAQMASNAENVSIWWRHHVFLHGTWIQIIICCLFGAIKN